MSAIEMSTPMTAFSSDPAMRVGENAQTLGSWSVPTKQQCGPRSSAFRSRSYTSGGAIFEIVNPAISSATGELLGNYEDPVYGSVEQALNILNDSESTSSLEQCFKIPLCDHSNRDTREGTEPGFKKELRLDNMEMLSRELSKLQQDEILDNADDVSLSESDPEEDEYFTFGF